MLFNRRYGFDHNSYQVWRIQPSRIHIGAFFHELVGVSNRFSPFFAGREMRSTTRISLSREKWGWGGVTRQSFRDDGPCMDLWETPQNCAYQFHFFNRMPRGMFKWRGFDKF